MDNKSSACRKSGVAVCRRFWSTDRDVSPHRRRAEWLFSFWILDFRFSVAAVPAQKQFRPLLPKTRACRQIDMSFSSDLPQRFSRSRTECCFVQKERATALLDQFPATQTTAHTFRQRVLDPLARQLRSRLDR